MACSSTSKPPQEAMASSQPGLLDPTQPIRLLNVAGSTWSFASFDPHIASPSARFRNPALKEASQPRRIVVEQRPDGQCLWRFVPKARLEQGATEEGPFPRIVDVCGQQVEMQQDQWDVYKLDPYYTCLVRAPPYLTVITRSVPQQPSKAPDYTPPSPPSDTVPPKLKRRLNTSPKGRNRTVDDFLEENAQKKFRAQPRHPYFSDDEDEVEHMMVDATGTKYYKQSVRLKKVRANIEEARRRRKEWNDQRKAKLMKQYEDIIMQSPNKPNEPGPSSQRRDLDVDSDPDDFEEEDLAFIRELPQRNHQMSEEDAQRMLAARRVERRRKRMEEMGRRAQNRSDARQQATADDVFADVPRSQNFVPGPSGPADTSPDIEIVDEEAARQAAIEESRRKLAELEADRPLWEKAAHDRMAQEEKEKQAAAARQWEKMRTVQAEQVAVREREAQEAKRRVEEDVKRREHDARLKREAARQQAKNEQRRWFMGHWSSTAALDRFKALSEKFDKAEFRKGDVIIFETIPWPVLYRPGTFGAEDVHWEAVEEFFKEVKKRTRINEYSSLVEKCHKRFHPDRWRSRRVLHAVEDEEERECLETAGNIVSQAMTPLWQELKET